MDKLQSAKNLLNRLGVDTRGMGRNQIYRKLADMGLAWRKYGSRGFWVNVRV